jgi:hypothetical protein
MSIPSPKARKPEWPIQTLLIRLFSNRWPIQILLIGLVGIGNFIVGCWILLPPHEGYTVYFWLVQFYSYTLLPALILFPISMIVVVLWFTRLAKRPWAQVVISLVGIVISVLCFIPVVSTSIFISTFSIIGHVKQDNQVYYLTGYMDDLAVDFLFCTSDKIGFSGQCRPIGWAYEGDDDLPEIYIDQKTNLVVVKSENPSFIWINSVPPRCVNDTSEGTTNEEDVGGCAP